MAAEPAKVAVYIDWQNVYKAARHAFDLQAMPNEYGNFSPYRLAQILAAGNGRGSDGGRLVRVEIHRGLPDSTRDPVGYGANRRQSAAWMKENPDLVIPRLRPLRYSRNADEPPVEKGVDVQLALAAVEHIVSELADVAIIFSHDTDLVPAIETITRLKGTEHIETASWSSDSYWSRLRVKGRLGANVFHHYITKDVFTEVATPVNYAHGAN
jgi:uncharacterized LabA/DUF88 family protein